MSVSFISKIITILILVNCIHPVKGGDDVAPKIKRPNILIIIADDCTYNDLPLYGGKNAKTPCIDGLAEEGMLFNKAYLAEAMCQPCRSELYTGQYPMRNGCAWNHSSSRPGTKSMVQYLEAQNYRVGLSGKVHVKPKEVYPFEKVEGFDVNCVRSPTRDHSLKGIKNFMVREDDKNFCFGANLQKFKNY